MTIATNTHPMNDTIIKEVHVGTRQQAWEEILYRSLKYTFKKPQRVWEFNYSLKSQYTVYEYSRTAYAHFIDQSGQRYRYIIHWSV